MEHESTEVKIDLTLVIETTALPLYIGLFNGKQSLWSKTVSQRSMRASHRLLDYIHEGLASISKSLQDVTKIWVSHGPGSFTGIKMGIAAVLGLKAGMNSSRVDIRGFSMLALIAHELKDRFNLNAVNVFLPASKRKGAVCSLSDERLSLFSVVFNHGREESNLNTLNNLLGGAMVNPSFVFGEWEVLQSEALNINFHAAGQLNASFFESDFISHAYSRFMTDELISDGITGQEGLAPLYLREASTFGS